MENKIKIFKNERFGEIRTAGTSEEPLFCLADVCRAIGIKDVPRCASRLEDDMRQTHPIIDSLGRTQQATFVTESGLYDVIIRSDSESAKPFRKWVTSEVLPSIRKTGGYIAAKAEESVCQNKYGTIPNYSNYIFDRDGNVYSLNYNKTGKTKILKQQKNKYGYMMIQLFDDNRKSRLLSVHRLIAMAFLPLVEGKNYVNHIDGVKSNNRVDNLEWCTLSENTKHSYDVIHTQSYQRLIDISKIGSKKRRKFTDRDIKNIRYEHNIKHVSFRKLASEYNCGKTVIEHIINHVTYK